MFAARVTTIGNSLGIVLSREVLARLRVDKGDLLFLVESALGFELTPYEQEFVGQIQEAEQVSRAQRSALRLLDDAGLARPGGRSPPKPASEG